MALRDGQTIVGIADAPSRRGRPTAERTSEIDAAIRSTARQLFLDMGFDATRMDDIATAARVSKGTLYARYDSKEALFRAIIQDLLGNLSLRAGQQDEDLPANLELRLRHHAHTLIAVFGWSEYTLATRLIRNASPSFPEIMQIWDEIGNRHYIDFLAEDMAQASDLPASHEVDWLLLANIFLHTISGWHGQESMTGAVDESEAEAHCDKVIAAIMTVIASARRTPH
ncbi:TetR/AcrR family transcriptional regulator [Sphingobium boeckii]|uniref:AcrR family transcriptional regulator n=1 Tax=Sphingobium boeckii TaxID=1082345 RepID=A0A7W9AI97_9SPHN|nr:TetR/AcrR family transcriptional regulator [Sphingobium boeckii]MBB5685974.1 AcrR family transcriptional regulator [Sphingobium boeckii]